MKTSKHPRESLVEMTEMVLTQHTNGLGTAFGGVIMSWVDIAAAICAQRHSEKMVVTASIDALHFLAPIRLGWVVSIKASINLVAHSSCEVGVTIRSENPLTGETYHTGKAYLTMVALDQQGHPTAMPVIEPETEEEKRRFHAAMARRKARLLLKEQLQKKNK